MIPDHPRSATRRLFRPVTRSEPPVSGDAVALRADGIGDAVIARSVATVTRAIRSHAALQDDCAYHRGLACALGDAVDQEARRAVAYAHRLAETERLWCLDRERASRAEHDRERAAHAVAELEQQLAAVRVLAERLLLAVGRLPAAADSGPEALRADGGTSIAGDADGAIGSAPASRPTPLPMFGADAAAQDAMAKPLAA